MHLIPITTPILKPGDDIATILTGCGDIQTNDLIVISSKAVATCENAAINTRELTISNEAKHLSNTTELSANVCEAIIQETTRLNGHIVRTCNRACFTQLQPKGLKEGVLLVPNAGLDASNVESGSVIGWPKNPVESLRNLQQKLHETFGRSTGLILSDSCCRPRRWGVVALALCCAGIDPIEDATHQHDLFKQPLMVTREARADQLATAANYVMGNADQSIPAVIVRNHRLPMTQYCDWVPGIDPQEDLFGAMV